MRLHKLLIKLSQMGSIFIEIFDIKFLNTHGIYIKAIRYLLYLFNFFHTMSHLVTLKLKQN